MRIFKLHICMITREFPPDPGGIGYYVQNLSKKLHERGHEITVITRGFPNKTVKKVVDGIDVYYVTFLPVYPFHLWVHGVYVNRLLKSLESKLTLIHLHSPITPPIRTSLPIITTVHTPMKVDARFHEILNLYSLAEHAQSMVLYPPIESQLFRLSNKITAVSLSVAKELKEYDLDLSKVTVIRNGVDEKTFTPASENNSKQKYILYTGGLKARKGLFDLIESAKYVCNSNCSVKFFICGKGPFLHKLIEKTQTMGIKDKIVFLGYVDRNRLVELYQNATIQVIPSHYEGLPTVILEGMSCGLPVVATNIGGNNEVISSGSNGFLIPPKSPKALAKTILELLDDHQLRKKIGKAARNTIEESYTWDKITDNIQDCYESIL
jgi:glycosyltransferase involved in cell wall biosynthesis